MSPSRKMEIVVWQNRNKGVCEYNYRRDATKMSIIQRLLSITLGCCKMDIPGADDAAWLQPSGTPASFVLWCLKERNGFTLENQRRSTQSLHDLFQCRLHAWTPEYRIFLLCHFHLSCMDWNVIILIISRTFNAKAKDTLSQKHRN